MKSLLKKTRVFWIYDIIITILLALCYFADKNPDRGVLLAWAVFIGFPIQIFEVYIAGPLFAIIIQKNKLTSKELFWSTFLIFTMTFFTFCIPTIILDRHIFIPALITEGFLYIQENFLGSFEIALLVSVNYYITNIIYNVIRKKVNTER